MKAELIDYIEIIYNRARRRRHLGSISPEAFAQVASRGQNLSTVLGAVQGAYHRRMRVGQIWGSYRLICGCMAYQYFAFGML